MAHVLTTVRLDPVALSEPVYSAADSLIDDQNFNDFDSIITSGTMFMTKYPNGRCGYPAHDWGTYPNGEIVPATESNGIITLVSPGYNGSDNALRINYAGATGSSDTVVGPEGRLGSIGLLDAGAGLPERAAPYTHFYLTIWFRVTNGIDPVDSTDTGVKGVMIYHDGSQRWEVRPNRKEYAPENKQWDVTRFGGYGGGYARNSYTGHNAWQAADGKPPPWSNYNDGNWHRITREVFGENYPLYVGERMWLDGVFVFDNVDDVWDIGPYTWAEGDVTDWRVFGNFTNAEKATEVDNFDIDFGRWIAWTDKP